MANSTTTLNAEEKPKVQAATEETLAEPRPVMKRVGCSFTAMQHARKFEVYLCGDGQLWRYVTPEDLKHDPTLKLGQNTLASGREVATFLRSFVAKSERRDYWISIIERTCKE